MDTSAAAPRHVVVATDLSGPAAAAVTRAAQLADEHSARLTAVHVAPAGRNADFLEPAHAAVEALVTGLLFDTALDGAKPAIAVRQGRAAVEIAAEAADGGSDLVVMGGSGEHGLLQALVGSTAENVVRMSPAPVLVVKRASTDPYRSVLLALDTTPQSADAARFGMELTPLADHVVVHVSTVVGEGLMRAYGVPEEEVDQLRDAAADQARHEISRLTEAFTPRPRDVAVVSGHPPTRLAEAGRSCGAELIVVGTGARSPMSYAFLGSVAQHVMREAPSDVLVVPTVEA
ncbi:hypothetical protein NIIDNTM18_33260 [Mycolicibacterium litorale]|uniref:UspA domain-containing protein n=1 Tax=Mycolicibacterium litorale TaxID=758802 RepID=A0A6S6PD11_9MYCO|nr:universal stress protein [Mycolicibacterium litorale]BCI54048.1 hypothetical protein NIIDNTM18_33260 [Mycolicibacterium litorale]